MGEVITLQVGQAGCQGGTALYQLLADEAGLGAGANNGWTAAADRFFFLASTGGKTKPTARAVLLDMEPKVVASAQQAALASGCWQYSRVATLGRQGGGSANNWAAGALRHAPVVRQQALGMLRRQAERCDRLSGFLVMQSAAGGTGSGLGSAMTEALRDEFPSARILNHCIWPFECGEVVTAPYNCLLTLASLAQHSDGVVLTGNEALAATCQHTLGIARPDYSDLNAVAAQGLASVLLPCTVQQAPSVTTSAGAGGNGRGPGRGAGLRGTRPGWDASPAQPAPASQPGPEAASWDGTFGSSSRWSDDEADSQDSQGQGGGGGGAGGALDPFADVCLRLCRQPGYPLLSLRTCPQLPPSSLDFTPFSWPTVLRDLRHMQLAGAALQAGAAPAPGSSGGGRSGSSSGGGGLGALGVRQRQNKCLASLLLLRGDGAQSADVSCFADPELFSSTALERPGAGAAGQRQLGVAASGARLGKQQMLASVLSNDQAAAAPLGRMLGRAAQLYEARAYVHHYERYGLSCPDFEQAFEEVEGVVERYRAL